MRSGDGAAIPSLSPAEYGVSKTSRPTLSRHCAPPARLLGERSKRRESTPIMAAIDETGDLWVFGYGSLMWRPGFDALERVPARLKGLHRALCVFSFVHRGTAGRPGLVFGLDHGGMCRGIAYRVAAAAREETIAYLRGREQVTSVYLERMHRIELEDASKRQVRALCYTVDRGHVQYAGRLTLAERVHYVRQGHGRSGANRDYVLDAVHALEALGYRETDLHLLAERLGRHEIVVRHQDQLSDTGFPARDS
jgi:glutathione-specific gamma-glutamylcyclotransferase